MDPSLDHHEYCTGGFDPEDIVISGMAGRFPDCATVGELKEGLLNKKNLIVFSDARYEKGALGMPYSSCALIKRLDQFDADFFQCAKTLVNRLDPATRIHMEVTYEAIADAGVDACDLRGQRIGIFNATTSDDSYKIYTAQDLFFNLSSLRAMNANRTSYSLGFTGPSIGVDTSSSSSGVAFWAAVESIKSGSVEAAAVSGCQLNLIPETAMGYLAVGVQSPTGNSRPYDANADGIVRAESVSAIFLQKAKIARRAYGCIKATRFYSAGFTPEGITVPSKSMQIELMTDLLDDAKIHPDEIQYVEGHGTGTQVGDPIEANAMDAVFSTKTRKTPLLLGSVKSNIGHTEASSGLSSLIKALLAFETGLIPPNINYESPNPGSQALLEGRVVIATEAVPLTSNYIAVNSLGFGGTLVGSLLKKNPRTYGSSKSALPVIPRLVLFPATTEEAVNTVFDFVRNNPDLREEFFALLNKLSFADPFYKPFRGYAVYQAGKTPVTHIKPSTPGRKQVWYIMTGMGCQWPGMGLQLMKIDEFARSIHKSAEILKAYGIDLFELLRPDKNYFHTDRKITESFVSICSIQIALVDLLKFLGMSPDGIIGHSVGELTAAYVDGACTQEQSLLSSYLRGYSVESANLQEGAMAAIGISFSHAAKICPKDVYPACDNAEDSITISGLREPMEKFVEKLKQDNVFVRPVNAHGYGFHCKLVHDAIPLMTPALKKLIPNPKPRSKRWVSTSFLESQWNSPNCKVYGPEYVCNNLKSTVYFTQALKKIPSDAIVIEIGPHFLLQSILKRMVGSKASYHGLMQRNGEDNVQFFMESLGKLYQEGVNPKIEQLYPSVKFPVPRGTPMISELIKWNHDQSFSVPKWSNEAKHATREFKLEKEDAYLLEYCVDGEILFPATGYVYLAWEALAKKHQKNFQEMPVVIENFKIERATIIKVQSPLKFYINILDSSGLFEIIEDKSLVASGKIYENKEMTFLECPPEYISDESSVSGRDIYDELKRSSYEHGPAFQSIVECSLDGTSGLVHWQERWIPFIDSIFMFCRSIMNETGLLLPTRAASIKIDPNVFREYIRKNGLMNNGEGITTCNVPCSYFSKTEISRSIGIEVSHLNWETAPIRGKADNPILEEYRFTPYISNYTPTENSSLKFSQYFGACNELMNKIGKALKKDTKKYQFQTEVQYDLQLEKIDSLENRNLLKILKAISNDPESLKNRRKEYVSKYMQIAGKDILNNALVNEDTLKIMLALISENTYRNLNVTEVNRNFLVVLIPAIETIKKYALIRNKKTVLIAPKSLEIDKQVLEEYDIQQSSEDSLKDLQKERSQDVAISSFMYGPLTELKNLLHTLTSVTKPNGFILLYFKEKTNRAERFLSAICGEELEVHSQTDLESVLQSENLLILSKISDPFGGSVYLLREPYVHTHQTILHVTANNYEWAEKVKKELYEKDSGILWLVAEDNPINGIIGMVNCLKRETEGERIRCVFISQKKQENKFPSFSIEHPFFQKLITKNLVINVWQNGAWGSYRHFLINETKPPRPMEHSYVNCRKYGDLSSFEWIESSVKYAPHKNRKLVHIYYSAVNFKDVMLASGKLSIGTTQHKYLGNSVLGFEFSGREEKTGKRICGFAPARAMATSILAEPARCLEVPENWTLEEAATVPVVYATCYYSLIIRARLQPGESILIHSGSGGIGIAAITIALSLNCEIFATVGNDEKRAYLRSKFPQIKEENIGSSRNTSFETMILSRTNGKGVDVILNSLSDDKFQANFRCIARSGRILEIGKYDLALDRPIHSKIFLENVSFHAVFLNQLFDVDLQGRSVVNDIMDMIRDGIKTGVVQPLDTTVFGRNAIEEAFRYMTSGVHVGKILLKIRDEEPQKCAIPQTLIIPAVPDTHFYHNKSYIIIGGLGGFGMEVTKWAIDRGARNIILTSRYGARTPYHHFCLKRWKNKGLNLQVSTLNVTKQNEAEKLLKEAMHIAPLGGIFNSALIWKITSLKVETSENYREVCAPKADATKFLDELTRKLCPDIDYFVCFSSISVRGIAGETSYAYANSFMERICEERRKDGLHGLAIQWGVIGGAGFVHRHMGDDFIIVGAMAQSVKSCLQTLDVFCQQHCPVVSSYVAAEQSKESVQGNPLQQILKILGVKDVSHINVTRSLGEIGIDSLVGIEIKQCIESHSDVTISIQEIYNMKLDDIKAIFERADNEKTTSKAPALMESTNIKLPPTLIHEDPVVVLSKRGSGELIFIVHIKDTDISSFQSLAMALNRPIYALVWNKNLPSTDMKSLAQFHLKLIQNITDDPYHLIGVFEGALLAFEMALQSERSNKKLKSVTFLSGSEYLMSKLSVDNTDYTESEAMAICGFIKQFTSSDISKLSEELQKDLNLDQRIRTVFNYLTNSSSQTVNENEISEAINNYLLKRRLVKSYIPTAKFSRDIHLLEDPSQFSSTDVSITKEIFTQLCSGKVVVHRIFTPNILSTVEGVKRLTTILQSIV